MIVYNIPILVSYAVRLYINLEAQLASRQPIPYPH
jgi:hypothetical protein